MINSAFDALQESYDNLLPEETETTEVGVEDISTLYHFKELRPFDYSDFIESRVMYNEKFLNYKKLENEDLKCLIRDLPDATKDLLEDHDFNKDSLYEYITEDWNNDPLKALMALDKDFKKEIEAKVKEKLFDLAKNTKWLINE